MGADPGRLAPPGEAWDPDSPRAGTELTRLTTIRGANYREIVYAAGGRYLEWANRNPEFAFWRHGDGRGPDRPLHPPEGHERPRTGGPGRQWIYQNTFADITDLGPVLDRALRLAGAVPLERPHTLAEELDLDGDRERLAALRAAAARKRKSKAKETRKRVRTAAAKAAAAIDAAGAADPGATLQARK